MLGIRLQKRLKNDLVVAVIQKLHITVSKIAAI